MKIKICGAFILASALGLSAFAQDSALQAAPGSGPPPQGWTAEMPPDGGIHGPKKKKKIKLQLKSADDKATQPESSPSPSELPANP